MKIFPDSGSHRLARCNPLISAGCAILLSIMACHAGEFIAITEIMRDPAGGETVIPGGSSHEFVEITNLGSTDFSLDTLMITDGQDFDTVVAWSAPMAAYPACIYNVTVIKPGQCAVILDPDYDSGLIVSPSSRYPVADSTILLTVKDRDIGSGLSAAEGVMLYKGSASVLIRVLDVAVDNEVPTALPSAGLVLASPKGVPEGVSAVAKSVLFSIQPEYEACPTATSLGTCELLDRGWVAEYRFGSASGSTVACSIAVHNVGTAPVTAAHCSVIRNSLAADTLAVVQTNDLAGNTTRLITSIPLDTIATTIRITDGSAVVSKLIDLSPVWTPVSAVRISEIFPRATASVPEWFEVVNTSAVPIDLRNWRYGNGETSDTLSYSSLVLGPGAYVVFTGDRTAFMNTYPATQGVTVPPHSHTLDNYQDSLVLWNANGIPMETAIWDYHWFSAWENQSLERTASAIDGRVASSWALADRPSPGQPNGSAAWRSGSEPAVAIGPVPFTPNSDGRDDLLSIRMTLPAGMNARIKIFGFDGTVYRDFGPQTAPQILWDGRRDNGSIAPVGPFFVVSDLSGGSKKIIRIKGLLWR